LPIELAEHQQRVDIRRLTKTPGNDLRKSPSAKFGHSSLNQENTATLKLKKRCRWNIPYVIHLTFST
jgi:hypothetical protein